MTTETIDIRIREDGSRVVKRSLQDIGQTASASADLIDVLKRSLAGLAGFLALDKVRQYADAWSSAAGQIRIATKSQEQAVAVQEALFVSAQKTRTAFTDVVELYARTARAGAELGASQRQIIQFSEGVGKSLAVQHVSAEQAKGALLQLGQAIGSGVVRAEEFNSILEGTPYILQIVAKNIAGMDGSIAKLRARMLAGKLTSKEFFEAFLKGTKDIDSDFAKSSLTIGQGLTLINNALLKYVGQMDEAVGISHAFGEAAKFIAANLSTIIGVFQAVSVASATYFGILKAAQYASAIKAQLEFVYAVASGKAVMLGSAEAAAQMAAAQTTASLSAARAAEAELAVTQGANLQKLRSAALLTESKVAEIATTQAGLNIAREEAVAKLALSNTNIQAARTTIAAAEAAGALSFALATARAATLELAAAEAARNVALAELAVLGQQQARVSVLTTEAIAAQTTATRALTAAQVQAAEAGAAASAATATAAGAAATATAKAAAGTSVLARTLGALGLGALANPWVLLAAAIAAAITLLVKFGDAVKIGVDDSTTLLDVFRAIYEIGRTAFLNLSEIVSDAFSVVKKVAGDAYSAIAGDTSSSVREWFQSFTSFYDDVGGGFAGLVRGVAKTLDAILGLIIGFGISVGRAATGLPQVFLEAFKAIYNVSADYIEKILNVLIDGVNKIREAIGASLIGAVSITRADVNTNAVQDYGRAVIDGIDAGFQAESGVFLKGVDAVFKKAQQIALSRDMINGRKGAGADLDAKLGKGSGPPVDEKALKALEKLKNDLRSLLDRIAPAEGALLELTKAYQTLDAARAKGLITQKQESDYLSLLYEHYQDIIDPLGAVNRELDRQTSLLGFSARAREIESQFFAIQQDLIRKGIRLSAEEEMGIRARLIQMQKLNEVVAAQDQLLANSVEQRRAFAVQLQAIQQLLADPTSGFTKGDAATAIVGTNPELFAGTQIALDAQVAAYRDMYAQIDQLRQADLISQEDADRLRTKIAMKEGETRLQQSSEFFGNLATLSRSGNSKLAAIGKAAAVAQATIDGVLAVQKALASAPPPFNYALAAAVGVAAAANVSNIISQGTGYQEGGYTGGGGRSQVAGFVHGQEFVNNADSTAKNRPVLEAMNRGADFSNLLSGLKIEIIQTGTPQSYEVAGMDEGTVRLIARDEVRRTAPQAVASEMNNPNSPVSKSFARNTQGGGRKR